MGFRWSSYEAYLSSSRWAELRSQRLLLDAYTCQTCGITRAQLAELGGSVLEVHHRYGGPPDYFYPKPWGQENPYQALLTLCSSCHRGITEAVARQRNRLSAHKQPPSPNQVSAERDIPRFEKKRELPEPGQPVREEERPTFQSKWDLLWHGLSDSEAPPGRQERHHPAQRQDGRPPG